jgi:hypothetical protein
MIKISEFKPVRVKNFLNEEDYTFIKEHVNHLFSGNQKKYYGFNIYKNGLHQKLYEENSEISNFFVNKIENYFKTGIERRGVFFGRYTTEEGTNPVLTPHLDNYDPGTGHTLTFTYVLDHSINWDICIQSQCGHIDKNEIVIFSGSTHAHWRPQIAFSDEDFYDIFVMHFTFKNEELELLPENYLDIMEIEKERYMPYWSVIKNSKR